MKKYTLKITMCEICPHKKGDNICEKTGRVLSANKMQGFCPLPEWEENEVDIKSAIQALILLLDSPTAPQKDHMAKRVALFLGAKIGGENANA